jgi:thiol-disulfide isomerase/thioredoxin
VRLPRRWPHWSTLLLIAIGVWVAPRLLPHVGALVNVRIRETRSPAFEVHTLAGEALSSASLRGKVVLVNIWATWCLPCRAEMPFMQSTYERHRAAGLVILGASVDRGDPATVRAFVTARDITYPIAIVDQTFIDAIGGVRGYPTSILIGRDGVVRHKVIGPIGPLTLEPAIRRALADSTAVATR